ncbi:MAG: hypothetical protein KDI43_14855 [Gammaproteobacteria bacterium]|nr:hypothetical protein [Gammaproteobacteria bacterium]MCP5316297.1 hypothetical protein [Chromatiaceae bacterium]MCP5409838.1 hypothetical protein [Chromatiaceae bacterium]
MKDTLPKNLTYVPSSFHVNV